MNYLTLGAELNKAHIPGEAPVRVQGEKEQRSYLEQLSREISARGGGPGSHLSSGREQPVLIVEVERHGRHHYLYHSLYVSFHGDTLMISDHYGQEGVPLSGVEQVLRTLRSVHEVLEKQRQREQKRDKIRGLKQRSIETQVDELARRLGFAYVLTKMTLKVKLIIQLDQRDGLVVDIPHNRIQEVLSGLEALLSAVRALYKTGLRFKLASIAYTRGWRRPSREPGGEMEESDEDEEEDDEQEGRGPVSGS